MIKKHMTTKEKEDLKTFLKARIEYLKYCAKAH